jgi:hypothetical protein
VKPRATRQREPVRRILIRVFPELRDLSQAERARVLRVTAQRLRTRGSGFWLRLWLSSFPLALLAGIGSGEAAHLFALFRPAVRPNIGAETLRLLLVAVVSLPPAVFVIYFVFVRFLRKQIQITLASDLQLADEPRNRRDNRGAAPESRIQN